MRDHSMFNFLVDDMPTKVVDLELINEFAKQAAFSFLGKSAIPLNDSVMKIASSENLNPDQIYMVCQEVNKVVNSELFKTAEDKYTQFELADASKIISQLEGTEKTASVCHLDQDYNMAPGEEKAYFSDFTMTKTAGHAGIGDNSKKIRQAALEKIAMAKQRLEDDLIKYRSEIEVLENDFVKIARNQLLPYGLKERRGAFPYIAHFCKEAGLNSEKTQQLMTYLDKVMVRQGLLEKSADIKANPELISDKLDARVVNGTHPLFLTIKTIVDKEKDKKLFEERFNVIKEKMDIYGADGAILGQSDVKEL